MLCYQDFSFVLVWHQLFLKKYNFTVPQNYVLYSNFLQQQNIVYQFQLQRYETIWTVLISYRLLMNSSGKNPSGRKVTKSIPRDRNPLNTS